MGADMSTKIIEAVKSAIASVAIDENSNDPWDAGAMCVRDALTAALAVEQEHGVLAENDLPFTPPFPEGWAETVRRLYPDKYWDKEEFLMSDDSLPSRLAAPVAAPSRDDVVRECIAVVQETFSGSNPHTVIAALHSLISGDTSNG